MKHNWFEPGTPDATLKKHVDENIISTITHNKRLQSMVQALGLSEEEIIEINKEI